MDKRIPLSTHKERRASATVRIVDVPFSALNKIFDFQAAMAQAAHGWIPLPPSAAALSLVLGGMLEVIGPVCILLNFYRRQAALLLIFYVIATAGNAVP